MESTKNQMSCESRTDRDVCCLEIANFTDHDHIRVLPHDVAKTGCECQSDLWIHMDLVDPIHLILDRIFDRDDLANGTIDTLQRAVQRRALAATRRTRHKKDPVRLRGHLADL